MYRQEDENKKLPASIDLLARFRLLNGRCLLGRTMVMISSVMKSLHCFYQSSNLIWVILNFLFSRLVVRNCVLRTNVIKVQLGLDLG